MIPIIKDLQSYSKDKFFKDFSSGITVAIILIPQAIAYAYLAGVPPQYGLYAGLIPPFIYGIFGGSRQLSIGPVAITSILLLSGLSLVAEPFSPEYISLALTTALLVGIFQFGIGIFRLGFLVNFLSLPVISGFISAAAIIIITSQLKDVLGLDIGRQNGFLAYANALQNSILATHILTFAISIIAAFILIVSKKFKPALPIELLVVVLSIVLSYFLEWETKGTTIVGKLPVGWPMFQMPEFSFSTLKILIPTILTVGIMGIVECISLARNIEIKTGKSSIHPNQELIAIGLSKAIGSFFQAIPSSASFSRTAINLKGGATTGVTSLTTSIFIGTALLVLMPFLYYLPRCILAIIIIVSVFKLIEIKEMSRLWKLSKRDFSTLLLTFLTTLIFGIAIGVEVGVILSILLLLYQSTKPHTAELGKLRDSRHYRNVDRFPDAEVSSQYLIVRYDDQLYFANAAYFKDTISAYLQKRNFPPSYMVLECSSINSLDTTGLKALYDVTEYLEKRDIKLLLSGVIGPVRDVLKKSGFMDKHGDNCFFMNVQEAVEYINNPTDYDCLKAATQVNL